MCRQKSYKMWLARIMITLVILSSLPDCFATEISAVEILEVIRSRDSVLATDNYISATFDVLTQAVGFDPNQGDVLYRCALVWKSNETYMKINYEYLQNPVYSPPDAGVYRAFDYDGDGNLLLWRFVEKHIISTSEKTEILDKTQLWRVSRDGVFDKFGGVHTTKHIFPADSKYGGNHEFTHFLLATGLNFSSYIDLNHDPSMEMSDGVVELDSRGTFGKGNQGIWKLTFDLDSDYFIRKASFTGEGFSEPSIKVHTIDIHKKNDLEYASQSQLTLSGFLVRDYVGIEITSKDNHELRQEVIQRLREPLVIGSDIIEFDKETPIRRTVK